MRFIGTALALASSASAFFVIRCPSRLVDERIDPIVNPGQIGSHVHSISGASGFSANTTYQDLRSSACTSCSVKEDLSVYWTPKLYYKAQNGSYTMVPQSGDYSGLLGGQAVYYLPRPGPNNDKLHAFPAGFRMVAGDPLKRSFTGGFDAQAISFVCLNYNGPQPIPEGNILPKVKCPNGIRLQVFFPACWDGKNVDSPDHKSHMAYPATGGYNGGTCPSSHPVHMISLFYEHIYSTDQFADMWYGDEQPFVLANGDPTGYSYHGDFINGWDQDFLQKAIDGCTGQDEDINECTMLTRNDDQIAQGCKIPSSVDEKIKGPLAALPGCNPIQSGPQPALDKVPGCKDTATMGEGGGDNSYYTDLTSKGWGYVGCGLDDLGSRTFPAAKNAPKSSDMTVESCVNTCASQGFTYAGIEWAQECYCGNNLASNRAPTPGIMGNCNMPCKGDGSQICGGSKTLSIYKKCTSGTCTNAKFSR